MTAEWWDCTREEYDADTEYHRSSEFKDFYVCRTIYRARRDGDLPKIKSSDNMRVGTALHSIVLEGQQTHSVKADCQSLIKSGDRKGKACGNTAVGRDADGLWRCGVHSKGMELEADENALTAAQDASVHGMSSAILNHAETMDLLMRRKKSKAAHCELAGRSVDKKLGVKKKCLIDCLTFNPFAIADIKTTEEFNVEAMWRRIDGYHYWLSMAHYESVVLDIAAAHNVTMHLPAWILIFIESVPPYRIHHQPLDDIQHESRIDYRDLLADFAKCEETNTWPQRPLDTGMPQWFAFKHGWDRTRT